MTSQFVSCDPTNLRNLANTLQDLVDLLRREGLPASQLMDKWGSQSTAKMPATIQQLQDVATAMAGRADRAQALLTQTSPTFGGLIPTNDLGSGALDQRVTLYWDSDSVNQALAAKDDADALSAAVNNPDDLSSRLTIDRVSQLLADNQNDPGFLQAFMGSGGLADATKVAAALHHHDGTQGTAVLSSDSWDILSRYSQATQAATTLAAAKKINIGDYTTVLSNPPGGDMWSMSVLIQAAGPGDKWDPTLLGNLGTAMLKWRNTVRQRPNVSPTGSLSGMNFYSGGPGAWYDELGLTPQGVTPDGSNDAKYEAIRSNDPTLGMLRLISESPDASRALLSDPNNGATNAQDLVNRWWNVGTVSNDGAFPAAVITAATSDRGPVNGKASAFAALNVINAASTLYSQDGSGQPSAAPDVASALTQLSTAYVTDLAQSANVGLTDQNGNPTTPPTVVQDPTNGGWRVALNEQVINGLFGEAFAIPGNADIVNSAIQTATYGSKLAELNGEQPSTSLEMLAGLRGISFATQRAAPYAQGQNQDQANTAINTANQAYVNAISGFFGNYPGPSEGPTALPFGLAQAFAGLVTPYITNNVGNQPVDNAQQAASATQGLRLSAFDELQVPLLQAALKSHAKVVMEGDKKVALPPPPAGAPWFQNGQILPDKLDSSYTGWVTNSTVAQYLLQQQGRMWTPYDSATGQANPSDNQFHGKS